MIVMSGTQKLNSKRFFFIHVSLGIWKATSAFTSLSRFSDSLALPFNPLTPC